MFASAITATKCFLMSYDRCDQTHAGVVPTRRCTDRAGLALLPAEHALQQVRRAGSRLERGIEVVARLAPAEISGRGVAAGENAPCGLHRHIASRVAEVASRERRSSLGSLVHAEHKRVELLLQTRNSSDIGHLLDAG